MIKAKQLFIVLVVGGVFVTALWYFTSGRKNGLGGGTVGSGTHYQNLKTQINNLGESRYDQNIFDSLSSAILATRMADNLNDEESNALNNFMKDAKTKALVVSFDEDFSQYCGNPSKLKPLVNQLKSQANKDQFPEVNSSITKYNNVVRFLGIESRINSFTQREFSSLTKDKLMKEISGAYSKTGVSTCKACTTKKTKMKDELIYFEIAANGFKSLRGRYVNRCNSFDKYRFYRDSIKRSGDCP